MYTNEKKKTWKTLIDLYLKIDFVSTKINLF